MICKSEQFRHAGNESAFMFAVIRIGATNRLVLQNAISHLQYWLDTSLHSFFHKKCDFFTFCLQKNAKTGCFDVLKNLFNYEG
jgi:hypothetical protein